jgi:hypothetical protein
MGDWVIIRNNGMISRTAGSSVVAINQKDPNKKTSIFPFGPLTSGISWAPPKNAVDVESGMIYSDDVGMGKLAGIRFDLSTGAMKPAFVTDDITTCLVGVIGPQGKRVVVVSHQHYNVPFEPTLLALGTGLYKEQLRWRDAATGRLLAESDLFEPMSPNTLGTPGFGGRFYYPTDKGFIVMQAVPGK